MSSAHSTHTAPIVLVALIGPLRVDLLVVTALHRGHRNESLPIVLRRHLRSATPW